MSSRTIWLLLVIFNLLGCNVRFTKCQDGLDDRIIEGEVVQENVAPFAVGLIIYGKLACVGSILAGSKPTILTAAHCVHDVPAYQITVGVGSSYSPSFVKYTVDEIRIHPEFVNYDYNDIALLYLTDELTFNAKIQPISLETAYVYNGQSVTLYGWGWSSFPHGFTSDELKKIDVTTISMVSCRLFWSMITNKHLCTLKIVGGGGCRGDSGGPLVRNNKLVGIMSWGPAVCGTAYPDVYTRISNYVTWIQNNLII